MVGRTHAQPGAPVTFGWKAASWADEIGRHLERARRGPPPLAGRPARWGRGHVGVLRRPGPGACGLRSAPRLGLADPGISWLTSRDRLVEQSLLLAMVTGTLARIGNEVMELQRTELGELRERSDASVVGSITMPHKRNPERSEHLDTLARLTRAHAGVCSRRMVQLHERDGRGWKAEWPTFPELCLLASTALALGHRPGPDPRGRRRPHAGQRARRRSPPLRTGAGRVRRTGGKASGAGRAAERCWPRPERTVAHWPRRSSPPAS